jgi:hypothetical protein
VRRHPSRRRVVAAGVAVLAAGVALGACGSSSPPPTTTTTTSIPGVQNLTITPTVSTELLDAAAAEHGLPASDYTGLRAGSTYYAYDGADGLYWAGAALVPSTTSFEAQVGVQDDGGYTLFTKTTTGSWTAYNDGLGTLPGAQCAIVVPASVRLVWGWSLSTPCGGPPGS